MGCSGSKAATPAPKGGAKPAGKPPKAVAVTTVTQDDKEKEDTPQEQQTEQAAEVKEESEAGNETNEMSVDRAENSSPANDNVEHSDTVDSPTNTETNATPLPPPEMEEHSGGTNLGDDAASEKSTHVDDTTELANDNVGGTNEPADRPLSVTESDRASPSSPAGKEETNMNEEPAAEPEQTHVEETPAPEPAAAEEPSGGGDDGGDAGGDE